MENRYRCYTKIITLEENTFRFHEYYPLNDKDVLMISGIIEAGRVTPTFYEKAMHVKKFDQLSRIQEVCSLEDIDLSILQGILVGKVT